jgi:hypothetical protein
MLIFLFHEQALNPLPGIYDRSMIALKHAVMVAKAKDQPGIRWSSIEQKLAKRLWHP